MIALNAGMRSIRRFGARGAPYLLALVSVSAQAGNLADPQPASLEAESASGLLVGTVLSLFDLPMFNFWVKGNQ